MSYDTSTMILGSWTIASLPNPLVNGGRVANVTDDPIESGACIYWCNGAAWFPKRSYMIESGALTTAADGTVTWTYPTAFPTAPHVVPVAVATFGTTDVLNVQLDGAPTTTQAKFRVTRTQQSVVALLGLTILSIPGSVGATVIHAIAKLL